jgi:hypothetical protein
MLAYRTISLFLFPGFTKFFLGISSLQRNNGFMDFLFRPCALRLS